MLAASSQDGRRRRARAGGKRTTAGGGASSVVAAEARDIVRRAAGDVAGKTVAAQIRQAARHLGYGPDDWRPRELWYGRCASIAALVDLRRRFTAWREAAASAAGPSALAQRVGEIRRLLTELDRQVAGLEGEVGRLREAEGAEP